MPPKLDNVEKDKIIKKVDTCNKINKLITMTINEIHDAGECAKLKSILMMTPKRRTRIVIALMEKTKTFIHKQSIISEINAFIIKFHIQ